MPARTIVQITADDPLPKWANVREDHQLTAGPAASIAELAQTKIHHLIVLIPASAVLLTTAALPKTSPNKLRQAVPYAIEEDLADHIEHLHFALGDWEGSGIAVGVIERKKLAAWLAEFKQHHLNIDAVLPDVLALPLYEHSWSLFIDSRHSLLRLGKQSGMFIDNDNLEAVFRALINKKESVLPEKIYVWNPHQANLEPIKKFNIEMEENADKTDFLQLAAATITGSHHPLNFLQGEFRPAHKKSARYQQWRLAAILAGAWIAILFLGNIAEYLYFSHQSQQLNQQITSLYQQVFPGQTDINSAQLKVEKELKNLINATQGSPFLRLLAKAGLPWSAHKDLEVSQLNYQNNKLTLAIKISSFNALDQLTSQFKNLGLKVEQSSVTTMGNAIQAQLIIQ